MVGGEGPTFPPGCIITVDPAVPAMAGDHVVVRLAGAREAMFRTLEGNGVRARVLRALNPVYPSMPLPSDAKIMGVVIAVNTDIRRRAG
jgi:SOS-response transcriptional repressor LexA